MHDTQGIKREGDQKAGWEKDRCAGEMEKTEDFFVFFLLFSFVCFPNKINSGQHLCRYTGKHVMNRSFLISY